MELNRIIYFFVMFAYFLFVNISRELNGNEGRFFFIYMVQLNSI